MLILIFFEIDCGFQNKNERKYDVVILFFPDFLIGSAEYGFLKISENAKRRTEFFFKD